MKKTIELLKRDFESSSGLTPEFAAFARTFKKELKEELVNSGLCDPEAVEVSRGHFYMSGFFATKDNRIFYFSISDVRGGRVETMLLRTAQSFKDYRGGSNNYVTIKPGMFSHEMLPTQ